MTYCCFSFPRYPSRTSIFGRRCAASRASISIGNVKTRETSASSTKCIMPPPNLHIHRCLKLSILISASARRDLGAAAHVLAVARCPLWVISGHVRRTSACPLYPPESDIKCDVVECPLRAKSGHLSQGQIGDRLCDLSALF